MHQTTAIILAISLAMKVPAQTEVPAPGEMAPELGLTAILGEGQKEPPSLASLKGKVVVLEFWATWCGACLAHMPSANALVEEFADEDLVYLTITAEDIATVERFMERRGRRGLIGIDANETAFSTYDPVAVPHMVLIDREGRIAASTYANQVTAPVLRSLLAGEDLDLPIKRSSRSDATEDAVYAEPPIGPEITVEPHSGTAGRSLRRGKWQIVAVGMLRSLLIRSIYDLPLAQMRLELPGDPSWTIRAAVPEARQEELLPMLKASMAERMGYHTEVIEEEMECTVLERIPGADAPEVKEKPKGMTRSMGPNLYGEAVSMSRLATHISRITAGERPCIDETGLTGKYAIELEVHDKDSLVEGLARHGLRYRKERRRMPVTVFKPSK